MNLYILAHSDDYIVYSDPIALAHWDGTRWGLFHCFENDNIADIQVGDNCLWVLHRDGDVFRFVGGDREILRIPSDTDITANSLLVRDDGMIQIVGNGGLFIRWDGQDWIRNLPRPDYDLICQADSNGRTCAGAADGSLLLFDGQVWRNMEIDFQGVISDLARGEKLVHGSGYDYANETGILFTLDPIAGKILSSIQATAGFTQIAAWSDTDLYASAPTRGVCRWDRSSAALSWNNAQSLGVREVHGITRIENALLAFGRGKSILQGPNPWVSLSITLGNSFLDDGIGSL